jgi:hypothetical protein
MSLTYYVRLPTETRHTFFVCNARGIEPRTDALSPHSPANYHLHPTNLGYGSSHNRWLS